MLSVLLKILAVLGIILLILLGIILLIVLIVLFVPITYRISGQADREKKEATVDVNWLFGILRFKLHYSENLSWQLKLLWIDLKGLNQKKKQKSNAKSSTEKTLDSPTQESQEKSDREPAGSIAEEPENAGTDEEPENAGTDEEADNASDSPHKKTLIEKVKYLVFKIRGICDKIKDIIENISYYINLLQEDDTKHLLSLFPKVIGNILKRIRPRKLKINAVIGFESPDTTGKIYGILCMLHPYYGKDICITPDFEDSVIEGTLFCRGRIYICILLINALKILFDKKFFKVIHKFKNGGRKNGR